jgi:hypothetical protein
MRDLKSSLMGLQPDPLARERLNTPLVPERFDPVTAAAQANHASEFHKRLTEWIKKFDAELDQEHEVGVRLVSFGQAVVFHLEYIGYWNPSLISFRGTTDDGNPVELIQHVSQISILLQRLPRKDPSKPKIGFKS